MAGIESVIYSVNLPPKLTEVRALLRPALAANGGRPVAANSAMYFILRTELAPFVTPMTTATLADFDEDNRANPIDAYNVLVAKISTIQLALIELKNLGVSPALLNIIEEYIDLRSPLHVVAATCLMVVYATQIARLT